MNVALVHGPCALVAWKFTALATPDALVIERLRDALWPAMERMGDVFLCAARVDEDWTLVLESKAFDPAPAERLVAALAQVYRQSRSTVDVAAALLVSPPLVDALARDEAVRVAKAMVEQLGAEAAASLMQCAAGGGRIVFAGERDAAVELARGLVASALDQQWSCLWPVGALTAVSRAELARTPCFVAVCDAAAAAAVARLECDALVHNGAVVQSAVVMRQGGELVTSVRLFAQGVHSLDDLAAAVRRGK